MDKLIQTWPTQLNFTARIIALGCFVIGSLFFTAYFTSPSLKVLIYGYYYLIGAILLNLILLIIILIAALLCQEQRIQLLKSAGLLLLNIPAVILYLLILFTGII